MQADDELARLRADLYRAGADESTVQRYSQALDDLDTGPGPTALSDVGGRSTRARVRIRGAVLAASGTALLVAALATGALLPRSSAPPPADVLERGTSSPPSALHWSELAGVEVSQRAAVGRALTDPRRVERLLKRYPGLVPISGAPLSVLVGDGTGALSLDEFGPLVEASSEIVVVLRCGSIDGRYRLRLSTLVQKDASIEPAPLRTVAGRCDGGAQTVRYRPLRAVLPTVARLDAPGSSAMAVLLTR